jgi:hypothetical protein
MPLAKERLKERNRRVRNRYFELKSEQPPKGFKWDEKELRRILSDEFTLSPQTIYNIVYTRRYD